VLIPPASLPFPFPLSSLPSPHYSLPCPLFTLLSPSSFLPCKLTFEHVGQTKCAIPAENFPFCTIEPNEVG
jgi:hypothetical protein